MSSSSSASHRKVHVNLDTRSYDILIGRGMTHQLGDLLKECHISGELVAIADPCFLSAWAVSKTSEQMFGISEGHIKYINYKIPHGETAKTLPVATALLSELAKLKLSRSTILLALGGGVMGDLAGFVAASYLRGIRFVQIPTTLLAMVDSSVGGKTGVNLPEGKNLVGAFHQPKLVIADLATLDTLPPREFSAGMAEVIKYGAIRDKALFDRVSKTVQPSDKDLDVIVETCVKIKARIVENDEFETKGERALLNFGHTIGHAIERATGYNTHLHGEAISIGMRAAAWLSVWQTGLPEADAHRIEDALTANGLPINLKLGIDPALILESLGNDKKVSSDGKNRWVLLNKIGEATSGHEVPAELVEKALKLLSVE